MISKNELKYFASLLKKKYRLKEKKFIAEGEKIVEEGLKSNFPCERIFTTPEYYERNKGNLKKIVWDSNLLSVLKKEEFNKLSDTINTQGIAAVFKIPSTNSTISGITSEIIICLENISDPGNLGTIIRNCDWFGIKDIILIEDCAEVFNPKVIRASMGSVFHLNIYYGNLNSVLYLQKKEYKIITADLKGENIFRFDFPEKSIIVLSNESSGPSAELIDVSNKLITIPKSGNAESLNVASASAVILGKLKSNANL